MDDIYVNSPIFIGANKEQILKTYIHENQIQLNLVYDSDFKSAKILRDIAQLAATLLWVEEKWKSRIILICDELNNNAVEYGSMQGERNMMRFFMKKERDGSTYLEIEVQDTGRWVNAKNAKKMEHIRNEKLKIGFESYQGIRGRGLFMIISSLVDTLYFKDCPEWGLIVGIQKKIETK